MPSRFDKQPYSDEYLLRSPQNHCLICGRKVVVSPNLRWKCIMLDGRILGYTHRECRLDDDDELYHGVP